MVWKEGESMVVGLDFCRGKWEGKGYERERYARGRREMEVKRKGKGLMELKMERGKGLQR